MKELKYIIGLLERIVNLLLKDGFLATLEKLYMENMPYFKNNKQRMLLIILANVTKKSINIQNCLILMYLNRIILIL